MKKVKDAEFRHNMIMINSEQTEAVANLFRIPDGYVIGCWEVLFDDMVFVMTEAEIKKTYGNFYCY